MSDVWVKTTPDTSTDLVDDLIVAVHGKKFFNQFEHEAVREQVIEVLDNRGIERHQWEKS